MKKSIYRIGWLVIVFTIILQSNAVKCKQPSNIHDAARTGRLDIVKALVLEDAERRAKSAGDWFPIRFVKEYFTVSDIINEIDRRGGTGGRQPIHDAARGGQPAVVEYLLMQGADVNAKDSHGLLPIHYAVKSGHDGVVKLLLASGAAVNAKDSRGFQPMHYAANRGQTDTVADLIAYGAVVNAKDNDGQQPLHKAAWGGYRDTVVLHKASWGGYRDTVVHLLENGADVNAKDDSDWQPIHYAALMGNLGVVKALLAYNADINEASGQFKSTSSYIEGKTPLDLALIRHGGEELVAYLRAKGATEGKSPIKEHIEL